MKNSRKKQLFGTGDRSYSKSKFIMDVVQPVVSTSNLSEPVVNINLMSDNEADEETRMAMHQVTKLKFLLGFLFID